MNIIKTALLSLSFLATVGTMHSASALVISDTVASSPDEPVTFSVPYTFTHFITDNGFVVATDTIDSATLTIRLTDGNGNENYQFVIGTGGEDQTFSFNTGTTRNVANNTRDTDNGTTKVLSLSPTSLTDLQDGALSVTVRSLAQGDNFFFASSTLDTTVTRAAEVPEPTTLALLGLGVLGFAASRRKSVK